MKKKIGKLSWQEKRRVKAGDQSILFSKLGIADDEDIERLKRRFGIKQFEDDDNIDELLEGKTMLGKKKTKRKLAKEQMLKESLKQMIHHKKEEEELGELMDEHEKQEALKEKAKIQELFRDDNIGYQPIIIKAS